MAIEQANAESVFKTIDAIRRENFRAPSNIFLSSSELCDVLEKKECFSLQNEKAIFIMIPYHNTYYDILFAAINEESLRNIIDEFKLNWHADWPIRVSVIGTEREAGKIAEVFGAAGFSLGKKLARTRQKAASGCVKEAMHDLSMSKKVDSGGMCPPERTANFSFAVAGDEKEILSLLLEVFDPRDDNIPELDAIRENIKKKQVVVVRTAGLIAYLHYFEIKNGAYYGWYDVTRKEYRNQFLLFGLDEFLSRHFVENRITINRTYGWRDTANRRLMKFAMLNNQICDGVYLYNLKWHAENNR